jgi:Flp pilus assembly protein CpaB
MKKLLLIVLAVALRAAAFAEPVTLSREQATKLHSALDAIAPGITPANTIIAADNLNALQPIADGIRKGAVRMAREQARLSDGAERTAKAMQLAEAFDAKAEEPVTLDLTPLEISNDEIKEAKISPAVLSVIRRHLKPAKK